MIQLQSQNVPLGQAHRRQILSHLKRTEQLGQRHGPFDLTLQLRRIGKTFQLQAFVVQNAGQSTHKVKETSLKHAVRKLVGQLHHSVHRSVTDKPN